MKFIVDANVGKMARWLRLMGYDAIFFDGRDDADLVHAALNEDRVLLTRDTGIMRWGAVVNGRVRAVFLESDEPEAQIRQLVREFGLDERMQPFTVCLECNLPLRSVGKEAVEDRLPPYVFRTQERFVECPKCHRVYWRGTHWEAMLTRLEKLTGRSSLKAQKSKTQIKT